MTTLMLDVSLASLLTQALATRGVSRPVGVALVARTAVHSSPLHPLA